MYPEQAVASTGGQGMEAQQRERGRTWVNVSCLQSQVQGMEGHRWHGGIRGAHTGRTRGTHRIAGLGMPWSAAGTSCVALGEVQALSPHSFIVQGGSMCSTTVLSSEIHKIDSNKILS